MKCLLSDIVFFWSFCKTNKINIFFIFLISVIINQHKNKKPYLSLSIVEGKKTNTPFLLLPSIQYSNMTTTCVTKTPLILNSPIPNSIPPSKSSTLPQLRFPSFKFPSFPALPLSLLPTYFTPLPSFAGAEPDDQVSSKIDLEAIVVSIDDFNNRNPFFVAGLTVIWLVVIPLTQEYLKKCKFVSAIDAFRKLRDAPNAQLLDIRKKRSLMFLNSPNLKILNKEAVQVEFNGVGVEEGDFVKLVRKNFPNPGNTVLCVLDNFDGDSLTAAELLFKNGFKEAYAIKGGLRGKNGWQAIQEELLPPSVHVKTPSKKKKTKRSKNPVSQIDANPTELSSNGRHPLVSGNQEK